VSIEVKKEIYGNSPLCIYFYFHPWEHLDDDFDLLVTIPATTIEIDDGQHGIDEFYVILDRIPGAKKELKKQMDIEKQKLKKRKQTEELYN